MCYISVDRYELQTTSLHAFFLLTLDLSAYVRQFFWSVCYHYSHIMCMDEKKMMKYDSFILVRYCVACVNVKWWKEKTWECELGGAVTFFFCNMISYVHHTLEYFLTNVPRYKTMTITLFFSRHWWHFITLIY